MPDINMDEITADLHRRADEGISGSDAIAWLKGQGFSDTEARRLCAAVILARRPIPDEEPLTAEPDAEVSSAIEANSGLTVGPEMRKALLAAGWLAPDDASLIRRIAEIAHNNCEPLDPGAILDVVGHPAEG